MAAIQAEIEALVRGCHIVSVVEGPGYREPRVVRVLFLLAPGVSMPMPPVIAEEGLRPMGFTLITADPYVCADARVEVIWG